MKKPFLLIVLFGAFLSLKAYAHPPQFNVLLFTETDGWHHQSINEGVDAMRAMAERHHFTVDWQEDSRVFNDERLQQYQAIVFLMTTGDILTDEQQTAMERFIQSGKGFVGIHSASDTEYDWDWYTKMVGRTFHSHPYIQTAELQVLARDFPGMARMPDRFLWTDEWYEFGAERIDWRLMAALL
jgi:type 1 glutamine amidotransferase